MLTWLSDVWMFKCVDVYSKHPTISLYFLLLSLSYFIYTMALINIIIVNWNTFTKQVADPIKYKAFSITC